MSTIPRRFRLACLVALLVTSLAAGQSSGLGTADFYGRGVHAYFAGRHGEAEASLSRALALNPNDPRLFYFRALSLMRLGRADEARADMEVGASLEAELPNRHAVGSALQRIQGGDRLVLEKYRRQALAGALAQQRLNRARNEQRGSDESQVLYQPVIVPLDGFLQPGTPPALTADDLARRAAAAESRTAPRLPPQTPASTSTSTQTDPFQDDDDAAPSTPAPIEPAEEAGPEDSGLESEEAVEGDDEAEESPAPSPQSQAPESTESQDDPFSDIQ